MRSRISNWSEFNLRTVLIVAVTAALPLLLHAGFLNTRGGGDSPFLLFRLHQLITALDAGHFPARWMPDAAYGLGYPFFHYYAGFSIYIAAVFKVLGFSYVLALKLTQLLGYLVAAGGMFVWIRAATTNRAAAWLAAAAYTFAPFHMVNVYVRGDSLAEFWAMAIFPLCMWTAHRLAERTSLARVSALAASYGVLIFTHNVSALIFTPFLLLYLALLLTRARRQFTSWLPGGAAVILGLALAAVFWLPALREQDFVQLAPVTAGYFHFSNHFRAGDLVQAGLLFDYDIGDPSSTPFAIGAIQAGLAALGFLAILAQLLSRGRRARHALFLGVGLLVSIFMITPLSRPLWEALPLLPFVQFPWRFLSVQALFAAAASGAILDLGSANSSETETDKSPHNIPIAIITLGIVLLLGLGALLKLRLDFVPVADVDVSAESLQDYEYFTGNIGTTVSAEYLPQWTQPRPYTSEEYLRGNPRARAIQGELISSERLAKSANSQTWQIEIASLSATIAVPLLYWPGWRANVEGETLDVSPLPGMGWTLFELPQGSHNVQLELGSTPVRALAGLISIIALGIVVFGLLLDLPAIVTRLVAALPSLRTALLTGIGLVVSLVALNFITARVRAIGPATADFAQLGWFHRAAIQFENGSVLRGYNYSADVFARGDLFAVKSVWEAAGETYTLDLIGPSEQLLEVPFVHAQVQGAAQQDSDVLLAIPTDISPGVYFLRLRMTDGSAALTPTGQMRGDIYLRPVRIDDPGLPAAPAPLANLIPGLDLAQINARQGDALSVEVVPHWQVDGQFNARSAIALRLRAPDGRQLAALDIQAGNALYPTDLWRGGEVIPDPYTLQLPPGLPPGEYPLTLKLYDPVSLAIHAETTVPIMLTEWTPRPDAEPAVVLTEWFGLQSVEVPQFVTAGQSLTIQPRWVTLSPPVLDGRVRWTLSNGENEVQWEGDPVGGLPLSSWPATVLVAQPFLMTLSPDLPGGEYSLNLELLAGDDSLLGAATSITSVSLLSLADVGVQTEIPAAQFESNASFGPLRLRGYDAEVSEDALTLMLHWQALSAPQASYKYFVHLFDPATEMIVAQADAFPQAGAHPTQDWLPTEVVTEIVELPLAELVPGVAYNLAVGWYVADTGARLSVQGEGGEQLTQDRYLLNFVLNVP